MKIWTFFSNLGTTGLASLDAKRVRVINRLSFVLGLCALFFIIPWSIQKVDLIVIMNAALFVLYSLCLYAAHKRRHSLAAGLLIFSTSTGFFVLSAATGFNSPLHYALTSCSAFSIILFKRTEKLKIIAGILYPLILLFILAWNNFEIFPISIDRSNIVVTSFDYIMNFGIITTTILCFYSFYIQAEDQFRLLYEDHLLAQNQLQEERTKSMASSRMAAVGEMAGGIAHEINNPLFVIKATTQSLIKSITSEKISYEQILEKCQTIERTCSKINDIIRSLKTISGSTTNTPAEIHSIKDLVEDTLVLCHHRFYSNNIPLKVTYETERTFIKIRPVELVQILVNLLNNAHDAVEGKMDALVALKIKCEENKLIIDVEDNGSGIPKEIQDKIFEAFFTSKPATKGTGLGLSLSKRFAENNDGKITFSSTPGHTVFRVEFPHAEISSL